MQGLKRGFIKSLLVPSAGADVSLLVRIAACAACPGCLQVAGVGWATPPFTCTPQRGLREEETRAQASPGEQIAGVSFSKTLRGGAVNIYSANNTTPRPLPRLRGGQAGDGTHLGELPRSGLCREPGVGPLPSRGAFLPAAGVFLRRGERKAPLPASERGFCVTQQDLPSNRPFLFKSTVSHTEDQWQFVFAAATRISLGTVVWD